MSKSNKLANDLPAMECDFVLDTEGELTKKRYIGEFTCKIMNRKERALVDKHRAFLNGDIADQLNPMTLRFHHWISYLRYALTDYPRWWKESDLGYELYDQNPIEATYEKVLEFEVKWAKSVWGEEEVQEVKGEMENEGDEEESKAEEQERPAQKV